MSKEPLKFVSIRIELDMEDPIIKELLTRRDHINLGCAIPLEYYEEFLDALSKIQKKGRDNHLYYDSTNLDRMPKGWDP